MASHSSDFRRVIGGRLATLLPLTALLLTAALGTSIPGSVAAQEAGYGLQPGDILQISVWREPDLQLEMVVRPDGGISMPLAGDLRAAGHTVDALRQAIEERISRFIPEPAVSVALREARGNVIYVLGKVARPGQYPMVGVLDAMQALSLAGGTTTFAALNRIHILRRDGTSQRSIAFRYGDVEQGRELEQNIVLESGDVVVVP